LKLLRGKRSKLSTRKKIRFTGVGSEPPCVPALRGDVQFATCGGEGSVEPSFSTGGPAAASRFEQFRGRERIRRPGGSASVGTGGNGLREGGAGFRPCVRTARRDRPPSSFSDRGGALESARPFVGGRFRTSPSTRSGRLTQRLRPTRLETRTKESNVHASRVAKETKTRKASLLYPSRG